jgi:hypothetical protein
VALASGVRHRPAAVNPVTTSGLNPAQLLYFHMDQFPGSLLFLATDDSASGTVHPVQPFQPTPAQYCVAGGPGMAGQDR